jgi:hypothetical protein
VRFKRFCIGALTAAALGITASPAAGAPTARPPGDGPDGPVVLSGRSRGSIVASVTAVGATTSAFPVLSATLSPMSLDGFGYSDSVNYPLVRNVSFVARTTDASFPVGGSGGGKPGAVREFLRWVCRLGATHVGDPEASRSSDNRGDPASWIQSHGSSNNEWHVNLRSVPRQVVRSPAFASQA